MLALSEWCPWQLKSEAAPYSAQRVDTGSPAPSIASPLLGIAPWSWLAVAVCIKSQGLFCFPRWQLGNLAISHCTILQDARKIRPLLRRCGREGRTWHTGKATRPKGQVLLAKCLVQWKLTLKCCPPHAIWSWLGCLERHTHLHSAQVPARYCCGVANPENPQKNTIWVAVRKVGKTKM